MKGKISVQVTIREGNILPLPDFLGFEVGDVIEFVSSESGSGYVLARVEGAITDEDVDKNEFWTRVELLDR